MIVRPKVEQYAERHSSPEPPWLAELAAETRAATVEPRMMVGPLEGALLAAIVYMVRPRTVLEIGTFTGYSALCMASALPPGGRIISCELDDGHADIAERHIAKSPWADAIEVRRGPALETLRGLPGPFDLVFIDADKTGYGGYLDAVLPKLDPRGVVAVDNVLQFGGVVNEHDTSPDAVALRAFNERVRNDPRVEQVVLTVREGLTLIRHAAGAA
ncbi:O-methyltransferase [Micromonospora sp. NPDC051925]|uniref:O-methyltransferase n=1 Tax=Micromonospora sp. NPDC051925 TaxID=3364288 RepID=UPI0037C77049